MSPGYAEKCRETSLALHEAMDSAGERRIVERQRREGMSREEIIEYLLPFLALALGLLAWEGAVRYYAVPPYILPAPSLVIVTLIKDWGTLSGSLIVTLSITFEALAAAVVGGVAIAIVFAQWRMVERAFFPFAVAMQVTPIVAIAPLLLIYLSSSTAVLVVAFLVAFFPILANTTLGLSSADHNLLDLFRLYRASRWQQLVWLRLPSALPYFLAGAAHRRRARADRRDRGGNRGGVGRTRRRARLSHRRIRLSPEYFAHVRGAAVDFGVRHNDLPRALRSFLSCCCAIGTKARKGVKRDGIVRSLRMATKPLARSGARRRGAARGASDRSAPKASFAPSRTGIPEVTNGWSLSAASRTCRAEIESEFIMDIESKEQARERVLETLGLCGIGDALGHGHRAAPQRARRAAIAAGAVPHRRSDDRRPGRNLSSHAGFEFGVLHSQLEGNEVRQDQIGAGDRRRMRRDFAVYRGAMERDDPGVGHFARRHRSRSSTTRR